MNTVKTGMLLAALTALFGVVGYMLGGATGMMIALGFGVATNLFAYWNSDRLALAAHHAVEVDERTAPELVAYGARPRRPGRAAACRGSISSTTRSPTPSRPAATRRTPPSPPPRACCSMLTHDEVAGVMAHELAHIKNRDTLIMTVSATIAGAIATLAQFGFLFGGRGGERPNPIVMIATALLAPLAAMIIQMAISRSREYDADRMGAEISGQPLALASALAKIAGRRGPYSRTRMRSAIRPRRPSSSSTRSRGTAWTTCSRPTRRRKTGSRPCSALAQEMGAPATPRRLRRAAFIEPSASPLGPTGTRRGPWG